MSPQITAPTEPLYAVTAKLIFLPHIPKEYSSTPLLLLGSGFGGTFAVFGLLVDIFRISRLRSAHYQLGVWTFVVHLANLSVYVSLLAFQMFPYPTSDQYLAAMAMIVDVLTGCVLLLIESNRVVICLSQWPMGKKRVNIAHTSRL